MAYVNMEHNQNIENLNPINESLSEGDIQEVDQSKKEKVEQERREILNRAVSGQIENVRDRVAYILNHSNEARNSDVDLAWTYWETFQSIEFSGIINSKEQLRKLARFSSLCRIRAKIQNEYKLFQANETVKRFRGTLEEDKRNEAIDDKPSGIGTYEVYIDETGKTQEYLSVGSLWILKFEVMTFINFKKSIENWTKENAIDYEFHFKDLNKHRVPFYKEFFLKFLQGFPESGFKLIVVNNKGFADKVKAITDLTYHLIIKGVEHENITGRAPLPRVLDVTIDEEEKGSDQLKIENVKERLKGQKVTGLNLGSFEAVSSQGNVFVQIVDLFVGAVNRKLHSNNETHFKDEFADWLLGVLKFDINVVNKLNDNIDNSTLFNLSEYGQ